MHLTETNTHSLTHSFTRIYQTIRPQSKLQSIEICIGCWFRLDLLSFTLHLPMERLYHKYVCLFEIRIKCWNGNVKESEWVPFENKIWAFHFTSNYKKNTRREFNKNGDKLSNVMKTCQFCQRRFYCAIFGCVFVICLCHRNQSNFIISFTRYIINGLSCIINDFIAGAMKFERNSIDSSNCKLNAISQNLF